MKLVTRLFATGILFTLVAGQFCTRAEESIPGAMPVVDEGEYDIVNFLLLGSDTAKATNVGRTDALMVVSVNRTEGTVSLLSIPRDLYVYIPGWQMQKINVAYSHGENDDIEGGGAKVLADTILYNLGIPIDYYARVDFNGFKSIVDNLGGVEVSVDCTIQDWRLREPALDPTVVENWEEFTLPVGVHKMDGALALWYVRSRITSSDFDRGRRQQDVMRALWRRIRGLGLLEQITDLWPQITEVVETNIPVGEIVSLAPLAVSIDTSHIVSYTFRPNIEVSFGRSPEGSNILLPNRDALIELGQRFMQPPTESQLVREHALIEVINASGVPGLDQVAADRLAVEGFVPRISEEQAPYREYTTLYDFTGKSKGSSLGLLKAILRVSDESTVIEPTPDRSVDFRVVIGGSYHSCTHNVLLPQPIEDDGMLAEIAPTPTA